MSGATHGMLADEGMCGILSIMSMSTRSLEISTGMNRQTSKCEASFNNQL